MTMPRGVSRALYAGNGQAVDFPFLFKVFEEDQLSVLLTSPEGVTTEATGWSAQLDDGGGTLTYLHNGAPLPEGWKLAIVRNMPFVQEVDLITGTRFDPEVIETALDVATAERQQLLERLARAVVVEPTDEAGPEALLADIRDARASAAASAGSAAASAASAGEARAAAAGSAAVATEQREAACICAGEAQAARDVAIAQAEAANTLMEAELAKVNAIVAANKTDQQAAVTAARQWAEKDPGTPVDYDEDGNPSYSARHWAENAQKIAVEPPTAERRGAVRVGAGLHLTTGENGEADVLTVSPDDVTTTLNEDGLLSALGGNLLLNSEEWLTESGEWEAPVTGWYDVLCIGGGEGGRYKKATSYWIATGGSCGAFKHALVYLHAGETVAVTIGAGGHGGDSDAIGQAFYGGQTTFGEIASGSSHAYLLGSARLYDAGVYLACNGSGFGGGLGGNQSWHNGNWYGAGGGALASTTSYAGNGAAGAVRLRWHDPAKAAGPLAAPALLSVADEGMAAGMRTAAQRPQPLPQSGLRMGRTELSEPGPVPGEATPSAAQDVRPRGMVMRIAAAPATVSLYDPETGQGSVWREEDAEAKLAEGLISQEAWLAICAEKAAEERAAWLASPDTVGERFAMLRQDRDARLAATDYLVVPDYPLDAEQRAAVTAYRQALRDLPAQEGAPWDGGGEATPWPDAPAMAVEEGEVPCA